MDFLQAVELRRLLLPSIECAESIPRDFVYRPPSVLGLAEAMEAVHSKQELAQPVDARLKMVDESVEHYSLRTQQPDSTPRQPMTQKQGKEENFRHHVDRQHGSPWMPPYRSFGKSADGQGGRLPPSSGH